MPKPVCVKCQRFFKPKKNRVFVLEQMPVNSDAKPGLAEPGAWLPYKIWLGDLFGCEGCGAETIAGFAYHPIAEHFQPDFDRYLKRVTHTVNDC